MKKKTYVFLIILLLFVFQDPIRTYFPLLNYFDDLFSYLFIPILGFQIIKTQKVRLPGIIIKILPFMFGICLLGLIGNLVYKYQPSNYAFYDLILVFKFIFVYISAKLIFPGFDLSKNEHIINSLLKFVTVIFFCMAIAGLIWNLFSFGEIRFGLRSQKLWYSHPTSLASASILILSLLTAFYKKFKENAIYIVLLAVVIISTTRTKAIAFIICYLLIVIYFQFFKGKSPKPLLLLLSLLALLVGFNRIRDQILVDDMYARAVLYKYSIIIANSHFPFGSGFGTYACFISGKYYSPIYFKYGINRVYGLSETNGHFISDTFWPMIIGQFGYFGFILFCLIILAFIKMIWSKKEVNPYYFMASFSLIFYLIITSSSESSFVNFTAVHYFFVIGIIVNSLELKQMSERILKKELTSQMLSV